MTTQRKIVYGLLLSAAILLLTLSLTPGQTYARYYAGASWNTVVWGPDGDLPVLTGNSKTLTVLRENIPDTAQCTFRILSADQTYADFTSDSLTATVADGTVTIRLGETLPPAGTYHLVLTWDNEEAGSTEAETVTFFINYSDGLKTQEVTE